jgi:hypothetical protein
MKSILVTGLESSCTRYVSKLIAKNLIKNSVKNDWSGHGELKDSDHKIVHFSLPEGSRNNFGTLEYFNFFDVIVICTRDYHCSLLSKNKIHQKNLKKAIGEHDFGKKILQNLYANFYEKIILYSYETSFILGEIYNQNFLKNFKSYNLSNIEVEDVNYKYIKKEINYKYFNIKII